MSFFGMGPTELLIIILIAIILFGSKKIPELARSLGVAVKEFRKATREIEEATEVEEVKKEDDKEMRKLIFEVARKLGIETEGRDFREVAREVIEKVSYLRRHS